MLSKTIKYIVGFFGFFIGFGLSIFLKGILVSKVLIGGWKWIIIQLVFSSLLGFLSYLCSQKIIDRWKRYIGLIESELEKVSFNNIVLGSLGLIVGLVIANLLSKPLQYINIIYLSFTLQVILYLGLGYFGIKVMTREREDRPSINSILKMYKKMDAESYDESSDISTPKILDTSVIIDGRILDICGTGFIEGPLVIAEFVLEELQSTADSTDDLRRKKGRRGLDVINQIQRDKIQKELDIELIISYERVDEIDTVDSKLLELARLMKGKIITNDYNLNKVAEIHGIEVLNINELANALKPIIIPGEEMEAYVSKDGKEKGQGLAYLDDGTMIVIESGKSFIGDTIDIIVTSALQTSAGKMIFARPKSIINNKI